MKGIREQTYYEILEVSPEASPKEIQKAYEHAKETFQSDSLAIYSLFTQEEILEIQLAIEEAYRVLMDEASRKSNEPSRTDRLRPLTPSNQREMVVPLPEKKALPSSAGQPPSEGEESYRGRRLKQIRERMSLDLESIARETKISLKTLELIEAEEVEKLPAMVYLKGFLKAYAQSLGLDPHKVVGGYLRFLEERKATTSS